MQVTHPNIIEGCKRGDPNCQKQLYELHKNTLFGVCIRYIPNHADAEDILSEGFFKILSKIHTFKGDGNFEGWMRRVVVNECLMFLRKSVNMHLTLELNETITHNFEKDDDDVESEYPFTIEEVQDAIQRLPDGYRTVFNLYVIDDLKHREIADVLQISINTSKSQLILAKKRLREILKKKYSFYDKYKK
ncbi:MAG: sigma-70 family RNA polymerase sigma factor [Saprospiraceae bacterium]